MFRTDRSHGGGTAFLQPVIDDHQRLRADRFYYGEPTQQKVKSQNPYMQTYFGELYCYTIDIQNEAILISTLLEIKNRDLKPRMPKELTSRVMLERVV